MHPRNRYRETKPDFGQLAEFHPSLKPFLVEIKSKPSTGPGRPYRYTIDFSNPAAVRELTCATLEHDFKLKIELPLDRIIPTVPQRLNYIHWIEDLLMIGRDEVAGERVVPKGKSIIGIDIGAGASCIYPLLGHQLNGWSFVATEVDDLSLKYAEKNVARNQLQEVIKVEQVPESVILLGALDDVTNYDFCMCNPPFFKDAEERHGGSSRSEHRPVASTFCSGSARETVVEGGEVAFVGRILEDSIQLKTRVRWYTSMLGKKSSLKVLQEKLKKHKVPVVTTTEFVQGKTWRWAIAWSFDTSFKEKVKFQLQNKFANKRPSPITIEVSQCSSSTFSRGFHGNKEWLQQQFEHLEIECSVTAESAGLLQMKCKACKNTWTHARKRRRLLERLKLTTQGEELPEGNPNEVAETAKHSKPSQLLQTQGISNHPTEKSQEEVLKELEALSTPCKLEFECLLVERDKKEGEAISPPDAKRRGATSVDALRKEEVHKLFITFEWISGTERDLLNQVVQFLRNRMH